LREVSHTLEGISESAEQIERLDLRRVLWPKATKFSSNLKDAWLWRGHRNLQKWGRSP